LAETGPPDREAWARAVLAGLLPHFGSELDVSIAEVTRAVEIFRADGSDFGLATGLGILGTLTTLVGRREKGASSWRRASRPRSVWNSRR
jgi:hypothetical protein